MYLLPMELANAVIMDTHFSSPFSGWQVLSIKPILACEVGDGSNINDGKKV